MPSVLIPIEYALPVFLIAFRIGELHESLIPVRLLGVLLSLCAAGLLMWTASSLGRFRRNLPHDDQKPPAIYPRWILIFPHPFGL
jgi:hypothetical protein